VIRGIRGYSSVRIRVKIRVIRGEPVIGRSHRGRMTVVESRVPDLTALDVAQHLAAALVYLAVAVAAIGQAPRDRRTQVFFAFGIVNAIAFTVTVVGWFLGVKSPLDMSRTMLGISLSALGVGGLLLFHFSQVFPRRRPWIRTSGIQLPLGYALVPVIVMTLARLWPGDPTKMTAGFVLLFLIFGFPLMVLLGFVLPVGSILSIARSYREAAVAVPVRDPRPVLASVLLSQIAGGILAVVFTPVLGVIAPDSWSLTLVTTLVWALTLLTPLAFAAGVWKYRLLEIDPDGDRQQD
jgi:hypothetical protein